jgi:hypothetical protein
MKVHFEMRHSGKESLRHVVRLCPLLLSLLVGFAASMLAQTNPAALAARQ